MSELDPNASPSFTREQAILIASRLLTAYLIVWIISDLIAIPREILTITHELQGPSSLGYTALSAFKASYYARYEILTLAANILQIALWLMAAGWFYRCGPRIRNFFAAAAE